MVTSREEQPFSLPDYVMTILSYEVDLKNVFRNPPRQDCDNSPV